MRQIDVYQAMWGMIDLPDKENPWTIEEQIAEIQKADFAGALNFIDDTNEKTLKESYRTSDLINKSSLKLGLSCNGFNLEDIKHKIDYALEVKSDFINIMVMDYFIIGDEAIELLKAVIAYGKLKEVKVFVETHRRTVTQDLIRTVDYVKAIEDLIFTIDLSHYVVSGELAEPSEKVEEAFECLLGRTGSIHLRLSNGEQVQVSLDCMAEDQLANYRRWWTRAIEHGTKALQAGERLPVVVELGPEDYQKKFFLQGKWVYDGDRMAEAIRLKSFVEVL